MQDWKSLYSLFENYCQEQAILRAPQALYDPVNYIMGLSGKRLRPILALAAYQLFDSKVERALPLAYALEIFHNFTLVHDDIMDDAPLRRGQASVHAKWNTNSAILSGDVMLIRAYEYLRQAPEDQMVPRLLDLFNRTAREVCEGQQMDIDFETAQQVHIQEYLRMIELKTAVLIAGALEIGSVAAKAPEDQISHLYAFGRNIGIAFQLQDDILDTFGEPEKFGKKPGGDIVQNKKTFLLLKALQIAPAEDKQALKQWIADPTADESEKIKAVTAILHRADIPNLAQKEKEKYRKAAEVHLVALEGSEAAKAPLFALMEKLVERER